MVETKEDTELKPMNLQPTTVPTMTGDPQSSETNAYLKGQLED